MRRAADFVVQQVNALLAGQLQGRPGQLPGQVGCSRLSLGAVLRAEHGSPSSTDINEAAREDEYLVELRTEPGAALVSATVRHHLKSDSMKLAGSVSRLNAYGNSSWCTDSSALKLLCHCSSPAPAPTPIPTSSG